MDRERTDETSETVTTAFGPQIKMPEPGDVLGEKYRLEAVLGRGGMSTVYAAMHLQLDQRVAIKVLSATALLLPEYVVRLEREASAVARIRSEHVVRVHDIGRLAVETAPSTTISVPYLVMECLAGQDLAARLVKQGPLDVELAVDCVLQACDALAEAHALGITHRDLKPANLFLTESVDGGVCLKVLDFGISRMRRPGLSPLTDPGTVLGTPSYMAPEQMEASEKVDARSDIWALGTILFELLVGRPPFTGESLPQIFMKIMRSRTPRLLDHRRDVPARLDAIIQRCLAVDPAKRYQTVAELASALATLGSSKHRESAARIARILERRGADGSGRATSVASSPSRTARSAGVGRRLPREAIGALAAAAVFGIATTLGALAMRAGGVSVPLASTAPVTATTEGEGPLAMNAANAVAAEPAAAPVPSPAKPDAGAERAVSPGAAVMATAAPASTNVTGAVTAPSAPGPVSTTTISAASLPNAPSERAEAAKVESAEKAERAEKKEPTTFEPPAAIPDRTSAEPAENDDTR